MSYDEDYFSKEAVLLFKVDPYGTTVRVLREAFKAAATHNEAMSRDEWMTLQALAMGVDMAEMLPDVSLAGEMLNEEHRKDL